MSFLFGSPSEQSSQNSSTSTYGNAAYPTLNSTLSPLLQNAGGASSMMASLLGMNGPTGAQAPTYQPWATGSSAYSYGPNNSNNYVGGLNYTTNTPGHVVNGGYTSKDMNGSPIAESGSITVSPQPGFDTGFGTTINPSSYPGTNLSDLVGGSLTTGGVGGPFGPGGGTGPAGNPATPTGPGPGPGNPGTTGGGTGTGDPTTTPTTQPAIDASQAMKDFANSTGMQFVLGQGTNAVDQGAAGKGMMLSGSTLKSLENYGQGVGQTYLNQYLQNLNNMMGQGGEAGRDLALAGTSGSSSSSGTGNGTGSKPGLLGDIGSGLGSLITSVAAL